MTINDLKAWRKQHGLSQARFAKMAKIGLPTLTKLESGKVKPQQRTLTKVRRGMKSVESQMLKAKPGKAKKVTPATKPRRVGRPRKPAAVTGGGAIVLSFLDLELLRRVLAMKAGKKMKLLKGLK
jgi:transcriptional regulator with XRE-family HTH domain